MIHRPPRSATAAAPLAIIFALADGRRIIAGATPGVHIGALTAKPKPSQAAMRQAKYRANIAEGRRCYRTYLTDSEMDALIVEVERLLDPAVRDDASLLEEIRSCSRSDFITPEEYRTLGSRVTERLLKQLLRKK